MSHDGNATAELTDIRIAQGRSEERIDNLEQWQKAQNGHLARMDARLDKFLWYLIGILTTSAGTLVVVLLTGLKSG